MFGVVNSFFLFLLPLGYFTGSHLWSSNEALFSLHSDLEVSGYRTFFGQYMIFLRFSTYSSIGKQLIQKGKIWSKKIKSQ